MLTRKEKARQAWMRIFERKVYSLDDSHTGKVEWDTAVYFYNQGMTPADAANKYVGSRTNNSPAR